ncbi:uncharacterized protein LOC114522811 [Dendronephthya gigantea]|uniref:uncharacterized protein LOC114522811 n=1 Tax=Dendronephthya gigantea TaxID=151771 RepID=UPI00106BA483|nr:uncharacterized protein LOC114522811 [Dendronephthya gigantea]
MSWLFYRWLLFFYISVITIQDSWEFFLRQTETSECIAPEDSYFGRGDHSKRYWARMVDNCLKSSAQFRYIDKTEVIHNIDKRGSLICIPKDRTYRYNLLVYDGVKPAAITFEKDKDHSIKQKVSGSLFFYERKYCVRSNGLGASVTVVTEANCKNARTFTFGSVTQFGDKMKDVHCSSKQRMVIHKAHYGDFNNSGSFNTNATVDIKCSQRASCEVKRLCGGNRSCELIVDNNLLSSQHCSDTTKELFIEYTCVDNYMKPITTAPNIKLSKSPSEGFIEIKDGSTWRKVKEEIWDIIRENSLCQHLGFNGTLGNVAKTRRIKKGQEIASGNLCYDAPLNNSVHFYPFTTTSSVDAPYVTCKICMNPLLQNKTNLLDTIFSGSGSADNTKYKEARFSSDGWCPTESGDKYLKIDLQNEYQITRVMVMGDKNQTKWSGSYSLKYSHDESLVDGSSGLQITGNMYSFQESTTDVDIYNVRYIKLQSTENTDFCLRIELCGEVQSLAPVQNVVAKPSNFSVHLSWTIPSPEASTFITHFIIYLNGTEVKRISRAYYVNQYNLRELTPNTNYVVGIKTQDGQLKNTQTIVYHKFKTKEAVPSGAPRSVMIKSRSKNSLEISWKAPDKIFWNGELVGYQICFSTKENDESPKCLNINVLSALSYVFSNLIPSTKYFVTVSAGTKIGFGNKSSEISEITNGEPVNPVVMSHFDLGLRIPKAAPYIREVLIIVQRATRSQTPSEDIRASKLRPYKSNTQDFYITAYLRADVFPVSFVIGDSKEYNYENVTYVNQPLQPNTSYNVFLRFFESQNSYYSTGWSKGVKTKVTPGPSGPPLDVSLKSRGKYTLEVSWEAPEESSRTGELIGYQVCFYTNETPLECFVLKNTNVLALTLKNLQPSTKYFVTVAANTKAGYGEKSSVVSKITNGEPLNPLTTSYYTLTLNIPKAANYIRQVMVIVQKAASSSLQSQNIETSKLKAYQANTQDPYVTAYLKTDDLPLMFVIGDGKEYNFKTEKYFNQPLTTNSSYIVFLRYFESQDSYYSTEWSSSFKTIAKAPAVCLKSNISKQSAKDKTHMGFLIPLIILALCFLVSLGVIVYQRRLLRNKDANHGYETSKQTNEMKEFDSRKNKRAKYDQRTQNDETVYETPDDVIEEIERNEGARSRGTEKGQESSNYMSLQDKKEPANVYQALQPSVTNDNQRHTKEGGQSVEYQNPAFNADFSGE